MYSLLKSIALRFPAGSHALLRKIAREYLVRTALKVTRLRPRRAFSGKHVVVAGLFRSPTGIGRAAELVSRSLEERGSVISRVDLTTALGMEIVETVGDFVRPEHCLKIDATDIVLVLNPDHCFVLSRFDRRWLLDRCVIGHWIWELETIPRFWKRGAESFDEIWAPTEFVRDSLQAGLGLSFSGPLRVLPYAVTSDPMRTPPPQRREEARRRLQIAPTTQVVGYSFSSLSNYCRKNPEAAVDAFKIAFGPDDASAILLLRCHDLAKTPAERKRLLGRIGNDRRIRVFEHANPLSLADFYAAIDVYLSPSRAEGYGLNLVEATQIGVPVITSDWRLAPDIAALPLIHRVGYDLVPVVDEQGRYADIPGARWGEPRIAELAAELRRLTSRS